MEEVKSRIKEHEGFRNTVYSDSLGFATIGYGHLVLPTDDFVEGVAHINLSQDVVCRMTKEEVNCHHGPTVQPQGRSLEIWQRRQGIYQEGIDSAT